ncbi:hypothetical protein [Tenacibaculum ovolyticum]|uniref:hypothetical protein n=1 Tax=Tenacibaculum ovolyticum TaxID=104270 RepID=UPI0007ECC1D4|nr:hypothetical protein [Tenacibaculum ovolyticum]
MRIIILLIGLLFFGCKTIQFNIEYTIDYSDMKKVGNSCGIYVHKSKITGKTLDGVYKVGSSRKFSSIIKFKKGLIQSEKIYFRGKLQYKEEQLKSDSSIHVQYYYKNNLSCWNDSKPYDSIQEYRVKKYSKYPVKVNVFYKDDVCKYTFDYDNLIGELRIEEKGYELEYIPFCFEQTILDRECKNNPLTYNTRYNEFNKEIRVKILNPKYIIYHHYTFDEDVNMYLMDFNRSSIIMRENESE